MPAAGLQFQFVYSQPIRIEAVRGQDPNLALPAAGLHAAEMPGRCLNGQHGVDGVKDGPWSMLVNTPHVLRVQLSYAQASRVRKRERERTFIQEGNRAPVSKATPRPHGSATLVLEAGVQGKRPRLDSQEEPATDRTCPCGYCVQACAV